MERIFEVAGSEFVFRVVATDLDGDEACQGRFVGEVGFARGRKEVDLGYGDEWQSEGEWKREGGTAECGREIRVHGEPSRTELRVCW
jgi:hypothetical protein